MYRKQSGHKGAWPEGLCHPPQYQEQEDGIQNMEEKIDHVEASGIEAEDLIVEHQG
jgi:hypothetical protein